VSQLPQVTGARVLRALERAGFVIVCRTGSHTTLSHPSDRTRRATVPIHGSTPVKPGTLRAILAGARLSVDEFRALL